MESSDGPVEEPRDDEMRPSEPPLPPDILEHAGESQGLAGRQCRRFDNPIRILFMCPHGGGTSSSVRGSVGNAFADTDVDMEYLEKYDDYYQRETARSGYPRMVRRIGTRSNITFDNTASHTVGDNIPPEDDRMEWLTVHDDEGHALADGQGHPVPYDYVVLVTHSSIHDIADDYKATAARMPGRKPRVFGVKEVMDDPTKTENISFHGFAKMIIQDQQEKENQLR